MRNRAKCKKCNDVLESFHEFDFVTCKCGEISITGGNVKFECGAKDWGNFLRVDDEGNEICVRVNDKEVDEEEIKETTLSRDQLIDMLKEKIKSFENLPLHVMSSPISHYDFLSLMMILSAIFREKN